MEQKEKNSRLLFIALLSIFFICLFNLSSIAATCDLPGDFVGLMGDPTPDGKVDFNDLMVFATAYGSETGDPNWNALCDICGYLGVPTPDGKVNFDDLMVFATNYGKVCPVHNLTKGTYYNTIQAAIDDADTNNTIEVSPGTYYENIDFNGKNINLRSTNPTNPDVVASTIIDGGGNGSVVTFSSGEGTGAVLQGFTITNGSGTEEEPDWICGGGIYVFNSSPAITGNIISKNSVDLLGGGIYMRYSSSNITGNTISENSAVRSGGGGIYMGDSSPTITGNTISGNTAPGGGGIAVRGGSFPIVTANTISENSAACGGGIIVHSSSPTITGNIISGNTAEESGGGIAMWYSVPTISENTISNNSAIIGYANTGDGGGIYMSGSSPTINGNIISENMAIASGGGICVSSNSYVKTTDGNDWLRNNKPPNEEDTNTYSGNTHGDPLSYTEGADVYFKPKIVYNLEALAVTYQNTSMEMFQAKMDKLVEEELIPDSFLLNELPPLTKGVTEQAIYVDWHFYPDATGYKVYRSVNGGDPTIVFQDEPTSSYTYYSFWDYDVLEGSSYTYYVTAYGSGWETDPSQTATIDTWLPACSLISPADESFITDPTPTFTWNPVGVSIFPYGSIVSGYSLLWVYDMTAEDQVWYPYFNNLTTSSATYNQDGQAAPLAASHGYEWDIDSYGFDENDKLIAYSWSEYWWFTY